MMDKAFMADDEDGAYFSDAELVQFEAKLLEKKREIMVEAQAILASDKVRLNKDEMKDEVDLASMNIQQEITFRLLDRSRKLLAEIERALKKLDAGEYGYCEGTGKLIPRRRLELAPWARHSVEHKENLEFEKARRPKTTRRFPLAPAIAQSDL